MGTDERATRELRRQSAGEWLRALPDQLRELVLHDAEVHAWVKHGERLVAATDNEMNVDPSERAALVRRLVAAEPVGVHWPRKEESA